MTLDHIESDKERSSSAQRGTFIDRQLPSAMISRKNPLFDWHLSRLPWPKTPSNLNKRYVAQAKLEILKRYSIDIGCLLPIPLSVISACVIFALSFNQNVLLFIFCGLIGFSFLCTIYYALTGVNSIGPQMSGMQWEPLRLTSLSETDILLANYAAIQVRVWQVVIIEIATRVTAGIVLCFAFGYAILIYGPTDSPSSGLASLGLFFVVLVIIMILILEPLWRMRTVTLIGMTMASWSDSYGLAVIATFANVLALLLLETIALIGVAWLNISFAASVLPGTPGFDQNNAMVALFIYPLCVGLAVVGPLGLYQAGQKIVFSHLKRVAFQW